MNCKETLKKIFCEILEFEDCEENVSFMELGGDSYKFTLLQMQIKREFGKKISLKDLYRNSSIEKLTSLLNQNSSTITEESYVTTDMLKTVYVGRKDGVVMGGQGSKVYFELECDNYDSSRFKNAVEKLTNKQMFLRAAFSDETKFTVKSELKTEIEKAKRHLSSSLQATLEIDELEQGFDFKDTLSRAKFEELNMDLFKKPMAPVEKVMEDSGFNDGELDLSPNVEGDDKNGS